MKISTNIARQSHFLGTKIRNLRKRNNLTMEDLSARCIRENLQSAPSVSYLSMIERGKRVPSAEVLEVIATVFQKSVEWFLDDVPDQEFITPEKGSRGGIKGMVLEPSFLFSNEVLQIAIPEMLSQTGVTGREFAHLLIRAHQEHHQNHFPDLERAAEQVGLKRLPLSLGDVIDITKHLGLQICWFNRLSEEISPEMTGNSKKRIRSFFHSPNIIYVNEVLKSQPKRLKYDLAVHIGHCVLHNQDSSSSLVLAGDNEVQRRDCVVGQSSTVDLQDIVQAWREFERSFFASALLCPKIPFRQLLGREGYELDVSNMVGVSKSVAMRRMTAVSPYPHWHYFDAYAPGKLKAVYRANGIPLPWGNMRLVEDPCHHWAVFRMINEARGKASTQMSILNIGDEPHIYSCESIKTQDLAGNSHVLCAGIDLNPAIEAQGGNALDIANTLKDVCVSNGGAAKIPKSIRSDLMGVANILNISWVQRGIDSEARMICARGANCPRDPSCYGDKNDNDVSFDIQRIQDQIVAGKTTIHI